MAVPALPHEGAAAATASGQEPRVRSSRAVLGDDCQAQGRAPPRSGMSGRI